MAGHGTILVVEDDPDLRDALETVLHRNGYDVIATGDGLRAIELANEYEPAVALVDVLLPGQSGFRVTLALKARFGDQARVIVMSGNASAAQQDYALASGAEWFLAKPFTTAAMLDVVTTFCPASGKPSLSRPRVRIGA